MGTTGWKQGRAAIAALCLFIATGCSSTSTDSTLDTTPDTQPTTSVVETAPDTTSTTAVESPIGVGEDDASAVESAFAEQFVAWRLCTADYDVCEPDVAFEQIYGGEEFENLVAAVRDRQGLGRKNTPLDPDPDFQRVDELTFTNEDRTAATIDYCTVDSRKVSVVNDDGVDEVFDETVVHETGLAFYELGSDSVWRLVKFDVLLQSSEEPLCDG